MSVNGPDEAGLALVIGAGGGLGAALVVKHFFSLLARTGQCVAGFISAKIVRTAAIELARRNRHAVCVALHPGTVDMPLSRPFAKAGLNVRSPSIAAGACGPFWTH